MIRFEDLTWDDYDAEDNRVLGVFWQFSTLFSHPRYAEQAEGDPLCIIRPNPDNPHPSVQKMVAIGRYDLCILERLNGTHESIDIYTNLDLLEVVSILAEATPLTEVGNP